MANTVPMESGAVDNVLSDLSVAGFQLFPACSHTDSTYKTAAANWEKCKITTNVALSNGCVAVVILKSVLSDIHIL